MHINLIPLLQMMWVSLNQSLGEATQFLNMSHSSKNASISLATRHPIIYSHFHNTQF